MARLVTAIHGDKRLQQMFLERYVMRSVRCNADFVREAIASGQFVEPIRNCCIDALDGPLSFRWLQGHASLEKGFAEGIFGKVIPAFQRK